ncbi:protein CIA1-like isoform X1 [Henckelia pumila]|uniref:protein CIA1-like isoform X1 n=1 Tax=Henckelia pumila TaxID=405737 RepID=UPI003C6E40F3
MFFKLSSIEDTQGYTQLVQWHPCKHIIFACGFDNTIKIWVPDASMLNWECIQTLGESDGVHGHKIWALAFNGRGNKVVTCSDNGTITIWSLDIDGMQYGGKHFLNGIHLGSLTGYHDQHINSVLWSREGEEKICTAAADGVMCFFIENGEKLYSDNIESPYKLLLKKNHAHEKAINSIQWCSQDNSRLASASDDGTIKIWELASLQV